MDLTPTEDQLEIARVTGAFCDDRLGFAPLDAARGAVRADPDTWKELADLGWFGLGLPADAGGAGFGLAEEAFLFTELGRRVTPGPFLATVIGAHVAAGSPAGRDLLAGRTRAVLAEPADGALLVEADDAELVLVVTPDGVHLHAVDALGDLEPFASIDPLSPLARARPDGRAAPLASWGPERLGFERALVLLAALLLGVAEASRDVSVDHVSGRRQFGRPIGSFQAVGHRCADMAVRASAARAQTWFAALRVEDADDDARHQALAAALVAGDAAMRNAADAIQNHGALGFTAEHVVHLHAARARVLTTRFGGRARLLDLLAATAPPRL